MFVGESFRNLWIQFQAIQNNSQHAVWVAIYFNPEKHGEIKKEMMDRGLCGVAPIYVYKENMNYAGDKTYISSVDTLLLGFHPNNSVLQFPDITDPLKRHNLFKVTAPLKGKYKNGKKQVLNQSEKSPEITFTLSNNHSPRFGRALVTCAGSGGEVIGCIQARQNVVAVEKESGMFEGLCLRLGELKAKIDKEFDADPEGRFVESHLEEEEEEKAQIDFEHEKSADQESEKAESGPAEKTPPVEAASEVAVEKPPVEEDNEEDQLSVV